MICRFCRSSYAAGATVCPQCGAPQPQAQPQPQPQPATQTRQRGQVEFRVSWGEPTAPAPALVPPPAPPQYVPPSPPYAQPIAPPRGWTAQPGWGYIPPIPSYRWQVVIVFVLYWFFFFPGLIANIFWWNQAKRWQTSTGIAPRGKGCLTFMLVCAVLLFILTVGAAALV